jgi:hypothetical protein
VTRRVARGYIAWHRAAARCAAGHESSTFVDLDRVIDIDIVVNELTD